MPEIYITVTGNVEARWGVVGLLPHPIAAFGPNGETYVRWSDKTGQRQPTGGFAESIVPNSNAIPQG